MKRCPACGETKPLDSFYRHKSHKDGRGAYCKPCSNTRVAQWNQANPGRYASYSRVSWLKRYGLTREEYDALFTAQAGRCAICGTDSPGGQHKKFHIDHDHTTGRVRGLLCPPCNHLLGQAKEDSLILESAIAYLERHKTCSV